jgi:hypothetical protein
VSRVAPYDAGETLALIHFRHAPFSIPGCGGKR